MKTVKNNTRLKYQMRLRKEIGMWKKQTSCKREVLKIWLHSEAKIYG
jgi:hypothetical protein